MGKDISLKEDQKEKTPEEKIEESFGVKEIKEVNTLFQYVIYRF